MERKTDFEYVAKLISQIIKAQPKQVITADRWNELFNLLITQGDYTAESITRLIAWLDEQFTAGEAALNDKASTAYVDNKIDELKKRGSNCFATCFDVADSPTAAPNVWYVPKTLPKPVGEPGLFADVLWKNGHNGGLGYNVTLIWGAPGESDNEVILSAASVTNGLTGDYSIPTEGTIRYQLEEVSGRKRWRYVSGTLLPKQFSTATAALVADKIVPGLNLSYLPGSDIYVQLDAGNEAPVMYLVPDSGTRLPVYGNGTGKESGKFPAKYILHLKNAGDHWQIINSGTGSGGFIAQPNEPENHNQLWIDTDDTTSSLPTWEGGSF